jgi:hypothetical protein
MIKSFFAFLSLFTVVLVGMPSAQADEFCFHTLSKSRSGAVKVWDDVTWQVQTSNPITDSNGFTSFTLTGHTINSLGDTGAIYGTAFTKDGSPSLYPVRFDINSNLSLSSQPKLVGEFYTRPFLVSLNTMPILALQNPVPGLIGGFGLIEIVDVGYNPVTVAPTACSTFGTYFFIR